MSSGIFQTITKIYFLTNILIISLVNSQEEQRLQEEVAEYGDYTYMFFKATGPTSCCTWAQAEAECRQRKALLVSVRNETENQFLVSKIKSPEVISYWIGLTALNQWDDYQWIDGTDRTYENWYKISNHTDRVKREKCVKIESGSGKWKDDNCGEAAEFICKKHKEGKDVLPPLPTIPPNGNCPQGWYQLDYWPKCYKVMEMAVDWNTAKETCRSIGENHDLMSVHSTAENMLLTSILINDTWIGGAASSDAKSLIWSDNSQFDYSQLGDKVSDMKQKCVQVLADELQAGSWEAISCSEERMFVCQRYRDSLIPEGPSVAPPSCNNENYRFVGFRGDCYLGMKNGNKSWLEAEEFCESFGAHLAFINDVFERSFIFSYLDPLPDDIWIGLFSEKGQFKWFSTWPLTYTNWMKGHPVNDQENKKMCVVLDSETQHWKVENCESRHGFLCRLTDEDPPEIEEPDEVCPDHMKGELDLEGHYCYRIHSGDNKVVWASAQENCKKYKTTIASFHSSRELKLLGPDLKGLEDTWIGLHKNDEGIYKWADGSPVDFVFWKNGMVPEEECVAISTTDLTWQGTSCTQERPFICGAPKVRRTGESKNGRKGLSSGAVAGIVIAVLIAIPLLACLAYYLWKKNLRY